MKIANKRAFFDYQILEKFEAGINLYGAEVKAVRLGHADLTGSHVRIMGSEAYLINAKIFPYQYARPENYDEQRTRKLLLHKSEIIALKSKTEGQNLTLVPLSMYTTKSFIKVEIALGKGKKQYDKKESIKKKDIQREVEQELEEAKQG
ncbi:MAG: SsrA-binding protein [Candidatus Levybacteria bacterium RIFCSPLOWO2_01_FULL_39_24]|nr:MAG: SsrA-binding protein [Candidatus Levybacteria bacterium RIFCSPHIGHO2_01_FULL_40_16]OGH28942.1 MAG: SsrA-binding protein [Candidatus Levybacteria bacterium RIFCSPHIGHO2_12_FULL_39_9]OGH45863.1 MAG: SsrA-binding protein [Candidatus Levybacteria bacterium RIFCSPLOWO2_01_FULL_39_24]